MPDLKLLPLWFSLALFYIQETTIAQTEEHEFIKTYGNCNDTSGVWQAVRDISSNQGKMLTFARRVHAKRGENKTDIRGGNEVFDQVMWATLDTSSKVLSFHNDHTSQPVLIDVVTYAVTWYPAMLFYFTKGTKEACVLYLNPWEGTFRTVEQYCDVEVPT